MRIALADTIAGIVFLCGAGALLLYTAQSDYTAGDSIAFNAGWFPAMLLWMAVGVSALLVAKSLWVLRRPSAPPAAGRQLDTEAAVLAEPTHLDAIVPSRLALVVVLTVLFLVAFAWLGYWISTVAFMVIFSLALGYRNGVAIALVTVLFSALTWVVFTSLLHIQIPAWPAIGPW